MDVSSSRKLTRVVVLCSALSRHLVTWAILCWMSKILEKQTRHSQCSYMNAKGHGCSIDSNLVVLKDLFPGSVIGKSRLHAQFVLRGF